MPEVTLQQAFDLAIQHHQAGRLGDAESLYRQILAVDARHSGCLHYLGVIAQQVGRNDLAVELIRQSLSLQPRDPAAHSNLGNALKDLRLLDEAIAAYRQAVIIQSNYPEAYNNLGNALRSKGQLEEAIAACRRALALRPAYPEAYNNLGNALKDQGQLDEAIAAYRQALSLKPDYPEALNNLGAALYDAGQAEAAMAAYRQAIALRPNFPAAIFNLGNALGDRGQLDEAISAYRQAIALQPSHMEAHSNLGTTLKMKGLLDEAIAALRQAIALQPDFPETHNNLGNALNDVGRLDEAIATYRHALALKPSFPEAHNNLGNALKDKGQLDQALSAYRQALAIQPDHPEAHSNLVFTLNYHPSLEASVIAEEHRRWNQQHAEPLRQFIQPHPNDRAPGRRLRIGYVSPDFRDHSVAYFFEGLLAHHDPVQVEVVCYADLMKPDAVTARLQRLAGHWRKITGMPHAEVAELIRRDGIDILVDMAGHTGNNRLLVFARKPAPVQVTWLGYSNKTWLGTMDYRLTDPIADPLGSPDEPGGERLIRLPKTFACFRPADSSPPVGTQPAAGRGWVTFASFHLLAKLNDELLGRWAEILKRVPASRLLLVASGLNESTTRERFMRFFGERGIGADRLDFMGRQTLESYLALHHEVDVLLDCHPFSGHTLSCHALWMGVPVVTLAGKTHCSRMVASVLGNLGLPELVATSPEDYVRIAVELAGDLPRLADLRATLRARMQASPLMDAPAFARDIEAAYRTMWRTWCEQPESPSCLK